MESTGALRLPFACAFSGLSEPSLMQCEMMFFRVDTSAAAGTSPPTSISFPSLGMLVTSRTPSLGTGMMSGNEKGLIHVFFSSAPAKIRSRTVSSSEES